MMRPLKGSFVVHTDPGMVEIVARGAGPAGAVGVELLDGAVALDLDGADVGQLVAVRFPVENGFSVEQRAFVEAFFGEAAGDVLAAVGRDRPVRIGAGRRALTSDPATEVDRRLSMVVVAADALRRKTSRPAVEALLALEVLTSAAECGTVLGEKLRRRCSVFLERLPRTFPVDGLEQAYRETLARAVAAGVLTAPPHGDSPARSDGRVPDATRKASFVLGPNTAYSRVFHERAAAPSGRRGPVVAFDPLSLVTEDVAYLWVGDNTLRVTVHAGHDDEVLWARLRDRDGTILAAAPLLRTGTVRREANLLGPVREGLVLDVVSSVTFRVVGGRVAAVARAADCGRKAARLERLGELDDAAMAWEECAAWHRVVGDSPREKLALRRSGNVAAGTPTILDVLLEDASSSAG
jgi:hypothetical protein